MMAQVCSIDRVKMVDDDNTKSSLPLSPWFLSVFYFLSSIFSPFDIHLSLHVYLSLTFPHSIFSSNKEIKEGLLLTCQCDAPAGYSTFFSLFLMQS